MVEDGAPAYDPSRADAARRSGGMTPDGSWREGHTELGADPADHSPQDEGDEDRVVELPGDGYEVGDHVERQRQVGDQRGDERLGPPRDARVTEEASEEDGAIGDEAGERADVGSHGGCEKYPPRMRLLAAGAAAFVAGVLVGCGEHRAEPTVAASCPLVVQFGRV